MNKRNFFETLCENDYTIPISVWVHIAKKPFFYYPVQCTLRVPNFVLKVI